MTITLSFGSDLIQNLFAPIEQGLIEEGLESLGLFKSLLHLLRSSME